MQDDIDICCCCILSVGRAVPIWNYEIFSILSWNLFEYDSSRCDTFSFISFCSHRITHEYIEPAFPTRPDLSFGVFIVRAPLTSMIIENGILMLLDAFKFIRFIALDTIALFRTIPQPTKFGLRRIYNGFLLPVCDDRISRVRNKVHAPIAVCLVAASTPHLWCIGYTGCMQTEYKMRTTKTFHRMAHVFGARFSVQSAIINIWWMTDCKKSEHSQFCCVLSIWGKRETTKKKSDKQQTLSKQTNNNA